MLGRGQHNKNPAENLNVFEIHYTDTSCYPRKHIKSCNNVKGITVSIKKTKSVQSQKT